MIQIKNSSFQYKDAQVPSLKDVSLEIPDGQCVLLCGESGCGKTTLSRLLNGLIPHYYEGELHGTVTVHSLDVKTAELYETAKLVGSVFQNPRSQFFCVDTTSEIAFGCENMGLPEKEIFNRIENVIGELNIQNLAARNIFELSGGEKQKIACASVAVLYPDVFVLDEPTSNLDTNAIEDLRKIITLWKKKGKTIVIAEHRLYWLQGLCDRVVYLKDGKIKLDISMKQFRKFLPEQLQDMGLRSLTTDLSFAKNGYAVPDIISLKNFFFSYGSEHVLHIPELSLPKGGIIAVVGKNGAGKSTFIRCLCGLEKKFKGHAVINGKKMRRKELLGYCYMVMQDVNHQLFCETVEEEIQLGVKKKKPSEISTVLKEMDLQTLTECHPMSLSGGQKQRVAIASAILADKSLLVFDEPTSGMDDRHMKQTADVLCTLKGKQTVIIVTHDPELIARCCTHVLHLKNGKVENLVPLEKSNISYVQDIFFHNKDKTESGGLY